MYSDVAPASFNNLTMAKWVYNYACMVKGAVTDGAADTEKIDDMRLHFKDLMENAIMYRFKLVYNYHSAVMNMIEQAKMQTKMSWTDRETIQHL